MPLKLSFQNKRCVLFACSGFPEDEPCLQRCGERSFPEAKHFGSTERYVPLHSGCLTITLCVCFTGLLFVHPP